MGCSRGREKRWMPSFRQSFAHAKYSSEERQNLYFISKLLTNYYFGKYNLPKTLPWYIHVSCLKYYEVLAVLFYCIAVVYLDLCETFHLLSPTAREARKPTIIAFQLTFECKKESFEHKQVNKSCKYSRVLRSCCD